MSLFFAYSLLLVLRGTAAFFPNPFTSIVIGENTLTHREITEIGILRAVAAYFEDHPKPGRSLTPGQLIDMPDITARKLFRQYYGARASGRRLQDVIDTIVESNSRVYRERFRDAVWHFNGETIRDANLLLIDLREQIIDVLLQENPNYDFARDLTGQFLHVLQMFYSNTNWVEMFGSDPYFDLGIRDKTLLAQAPSSMKTCRSCGGLTGNSCQNTLTLDSDILTSGYRTGQDEFKPFRNPLIFKTGKCSHGGLFDLSGAVIAALGGINKDSERSILSPRHDLHQAAAQAAIDHTTFFLNDEEFGLRNIIGKRRYKQFLQLRPGRSLVFAIDVSGSMRDDIDAVKDVMTRVTERSVGTIYEPSNYVFVTFNDPISLTSVYQTDDSDEALAYIMALTVDGGGDCPEYLMDGVEKALRASRRKSRIFIFTDAPAKDPERFPFVLNLAIRKKVRVKLFTTNACSIARRTAVEGQGVSELSADLLSSETGSKIPTPPPEDLYSALATGTGGSLYVASKTSISQVARVITETFVESVPILKRNLASTDSSDIDINVDNTVYQLTIEILGDETLLEIYNPSGDNETNNLNITDLSVGKLIAIEDPSSGVWRLTRLNSTPWTVEVTAQSTLDITSTFVQVDPETGFEYEITGRPVAGEDATIVIYVPSNDMISRLDRIHLIDTDGAELARYDNPTLIDSRSDTSLYRIQFPLPTEEFQVAVSGLDTFGNRFTRLQDGQIAPVDIDLYLLPTEETLYVNETIDLKFVVVNKGDTTSNFTVTITDDQQFAQAPLDRYYTLDPNENATGEFVLQSGETSGVTTTVTVSASSESSTVNSSIEQFVVARISTAMRIMRLQDNTLPFCNITSVIGKCDIEKLDSCTCTQEKWSGTAIIGDEGFGLYQISSSVKDGGSFVHDPFTAGHTINNGTIFATIMSDCCNPEIFITVVDMASNTGMCVFDLAPGLETAFPECKSTDQSQASEATTTIIAAAAGGGALIVAIVVAAIVYVVVKSKKTKIDPSKNGFEYEIDAKH